MGVVVLATTPSRRRARRPGGARRHRRDGRAGRLLPRAGGRDDEHRRADLGHRRDGSRGGRDRHGRPADHVQVVGLVLTLVGVVLASRERWRRRHAAGRATIGLALAAVGFGAFFVGMDRGLGDASVVGCWSPRGARSCCCRRVALVGAPARPGDPRPGDDRRDRRAGPGRHRLLRAGHQEGLLSVVAVVGSLYPVATVLLARSCCRARAPIQGVGVVLSRGVADRRRLTPSSDSSSAIVSPAAGGGPWPCRSPAGLRLPGRSSTNTICYGARPSRSRPARRCPGRACACRPRRR